MANLNLYKISDILIPNTNKIKSWQHINYEATGTIKKGATLTWYKILAQHLHNTNTKFDNNFSITKHKPITTKRSKLEWIYDF